LKNTEANQFNHHILLSQEDISKRVVELGVSITEYYKDETVTVLALTNGALIFAADIIRQIKCPVRLDTFAIASYNNRKSSGKLNLRSKPKLNVSGQHILVLDDILDTGLTLHSVKAWLQEKNAASINICVLLDKQVPQRKAEISANWAGFKIPDVFVYGYGLDRDEFDRNLPFIAQIAD
jgi:hypoxanthine phosphoribosyltransferase